MKKLWNDGWTCSKTGLPLNPSHKVCTLLRSDDETSAFFNVVVPIDISPLLDCEMWTIGQWVFEPLP